MAEREVDEPAAACRSVEDWRILATRYNVDHDGASVAELSILVMNAILERENESVAAALAELSVEEVKSYESWFGTVREAVLKRTPKSTFSKYDKNRICMEGSGILVRRRHLTDQEQDMIDQFSKEVKKVYAVILKLIEQLSVADASVNTVAKPELKELVSRLSPHYRVGEVDAPAPATLGHILEQLALSDITEEMTTDAKKLMNNVHGPFLQLYTEVTYGRTQWAGMIRLLNNGKLAELLTRDLTTNVVTSPFPVLMLCDAPVPEGMLRGKEKRVDVLITGISDQQTSWTEGIIQEREACGNNRKTSVSLSDCRSRKGDRVKCARVVYDVMSHTPHHGDINLFEESNVLLPMLPSLQIFHTERFVYLDLNFRIGEGLIFQTEQYYSQFSGDNAIVSAMLLFRVLIAAQIRQHAEQAKLIHDETQKLPVRPKVANPSPDTPAKRTKPKPQLPPSSLGSMATKATTVPAVGGNSDSTCEIVVDDVATNYRFGDTLTQRGDVFNGTRLSDGEKVVLKVLTPSHTPLELDMLRRANTLPGVVRLLNVFIDDADRVVVVMERLDPIPTDLNQEELISLLADFVVTLAGLAKLGIVHNDIHLFNILYSVRHGTLKLIDFGHSVACGHVTWWKPLVGEGFCPPERANVEESAAYPSTDAFAYGVFIALLAADDLYPSVWTPAWGRGYPLWQRFSSRSGGCLHPLAMVASMLTQEDPDARWTLDDAALFLRDRLRSMQQRQEQQQQQQQ